MSLTRSSQTFLQADVDRRAGLFKQPKRANVALTRAEKALVVVGNPVIMESDQVWSQWLQFCLENGLWYGENGRIRTWDEQQG